MQMYLNGTQITADMDDSLTRAVIISLFTWRRADEGDIYDGGQKYGWWGDTFNDNDRIGSKLWQLLRRSLTDETVNEAREMCESALQWLIDDGVCESVTVDTERNGNDRLDISVALTVSGKDIHYTFEDL